MNVAVEVKTSEPRITVRGSNVVHFQEWVGEKTKQQIKQDVSSNQNQGSINMMEMEIPNSNMPVLWSPDPGTRQRIIDLQDKLPGQQREKFYQDILKSSLDSLASNSLRSLFDTIKIWDEIAQSLLSLKPYTVGKSMIINAGTEAIRLKELRSGAKEFEAEVELKPFNKHSIAPSSLEHVDEYVYLDYSRSGSQPINVDIMYIDSNRHSLKHVLDHEV